MEESQQFRVAVWRERRAFEAKRLRWGAILLNLIFGSACAFFILSNNRGTRLALLPIGFCTYALYFNIRDRLILRTFRKESLTQFQKTDSDLVCIEATARCTLDGKAYAYDSGLLIIIGGNLLFEGMNTVWSEALSQENMEHDGAHLFVNYGRRIMAQFAITGESEEGITALRAGLQRSQATQPPVRMLPPLSTRDDDLLTSPWFWVKFVPAMTVILFLLTFDFSATLLGLFLTILLPAFALILLFNREADRKRQLTADELDQKLQQIKTELLLPNSLTVEPLQSEPLRE